MVLTYTQESSDLEIRVYSNAPLDANRVWVEKSRLLNSITFVFLENASLHTFLFKPYSVLYGSQQFFFHHRELILIFHPDAHRQCWTSILIIPNQYRQSCRAEKASFKNRRFSYVQLLISSTTGKTEKAQFCPRLWKKVFQGNETKLAKAASHNPVSPVPPSSWLTLRRRTSSLPRHLLATEGRPPSITHQRAKLKNFNLGLKGISLLIALKK